MSKKSKKKKRRRRSQCSSEEEQVTNKRDEANTSTTSDGKQRVKCQESSAAKCGNSGSSAVKGDAQCSRQIKKPVYRLGETQAADRKSVIKDGDSAERKSVQVHRGRSSSKANVSGKGNTVSGSKTVEKKPSDPLSITSAILQRKDRTSKVSVDEKSSQRSPSKLKAPLMTPRLVSAEQKDQRHNILKKRQAEEPLRVECDSSSVKTKKPRNTTSASDSSGLKWVPLKEICQKNPEKDCKAKTRMHSHTQLPSASSTERSSTHSTSESTSKVPRNVLSGSSRTAQSSSPQQIHSFTQPLRFNFKIPIKRLPRPADSADGKKDVPSNNTVSDVKKETKRPDSEVSVKNITQESVREPHKCLTVTASFPPKVQDKRLPLPSQHSTMSNTDTAPGDDEMQVVEELHLARSQKILGVEVTQSYGELTCMDIDVPEENTIEAPCKQALQQVLILVLDTNILLSHLDYVKKIRSHGLRDLGFPVILIPWVVLQELDSLKNRKHLSHSVEHLATPAISFIYNCLKSREPYLWGQSMQQATESRYGLNAENNDDRVLQCCLQYQSLYPGCALILCTNDKNLCSKALLSGVKALSQKDLKEELGTSRDGHHLLQKLQIPTLPHTNQQVSPSVPSSSHEAVQQYSQSRTRLSLGFTDKVIDGQQLSEDKWDLSRCVSELEDCLKEVLSDVLEVEMKAVYEDLWLEIVYVKPPWTLKDVLQCFNKHWIAVFGFIVPRSKQQTILNLINFFTSGQKVNLSATLEVLQGAMDLVKAFRRSSSRAAHAVSQMDNILNKLLQRDSPAVDVVMTDEEDKQPASARVSHQEVWVLFENIWSNVYQVSLEVFKALGFDPHTMQSAHPAPGPPPPQEALACLHRLSSMVSQLLQAFSSVLSSPSGLEEVQTLLSVIHSNEIVPVDQRLTARDLLDCFSHQEYREKLRVGGSQLMELKEILDRCAEATGPSAALTAYL
ncbi:transcriptional protein SWT1 [Betta splendens]|uniref:Transcriptional protein SWT1 n=1 Tax=Betta splendens TaxID=158456 RepID=A0A6P7M7I4_BETSP|nr:transcriptional protein SWT1 [Betta splendens]